MYVKRIMSFPETITQKIRKILYLREVIEGLKSVVHRDSGSLSEAKKDPHFLQCDIESLEQWVFRAKDDLKIAESALMYLEGYNDLACNKLKNLKLKYPGDDLAERFECAIKLENFGIPKEHIDCNLNSKILKKIITYLSV